MGSSFIRRLLVDVEWIARRLTYYHKMFDIAFRKLTECIPYYRITYVVVLEWACRYVYIHRMCLDQPLEHENFQSCFQCFEISD
jgi:hypothetical protein